MIVRNARRLRWIVLASAAIVALLTLFAIASAFSDPVEGVDISFSPVGSAYAELAVALLSGIPFIIGLFHLARMLKGIEQGEIFTSRTIAGLKGFAFFVLLSALASILVPPIIAVASALSAAGREVRVALTFDGGDFFVLLVSALLFLLARLLGEAQRIEDENRQIV